MHIRSSRRRRTDRAATACTGIADRRPPSAAFNRVAYAAAHVVADPLRDDRTLGHAGRRLGRTLAFRHHLWALGFRIAEAMDTSQRGMGFDWANAKELIRRSIAEAKTVEGADLACGAGTDQLDPACAAIARRRDRRL